MMGFIRNLRQHLVERGRIHDRITRVEAIRLEHHNELTERIARLERDMHRHI